MSGRCESRVRTRTIGCRDRAALLALALVSRSRTERLVNLVICLLSTRRFLTAAQIAATVPGYEHDAEDAREHEAFQRKFERDKAELRELGVPLETGTASVFDAEPGYRIARRDYALPDDPARARRGGRGRRRRPAVAARRSGRRRDARAWPSCAPAASRSTRTPPSAWSRWSPSTRRSTPLASRRPGAAGGRLLLPRRPRTTRPTHPATCSRGAWSAGAAAGTSSATTPIATHPLLPAVAHRRRGAADRRAAARTSRPADLDLISYVASWSGPVERTSGPRDAGAAGPRRRGAPLGGARCEPSAGRRRADAALRRSDGLAAWLVGYGADVTVLEPAEVREAIVARLREIGGTRRHPTRSPGPTRPAACRTRREVAA